MQAALSGLVTMQPRSQTRSAIVAVIGAFAVITALCLPFLLTGIDIPTGVVLAGRWIPALASLVAVLVLLDRGQVLRLWKVRQTSLREIAASYGLALAVMLPVLVAPTIVGLVVGGHLQPWTALATALPMIVVSTVVLSFSTFGEEVLWRGHLQTVLRSLGFWRMSGIIAMVWMLWHLPLHLTYLAQGTLTGSEVLATTIGVAAWAPLLAALVERRGTIWPAVFAHAVPLSSLQLLAPESTTNPVTFWAVTSSSWTFLIVAAAVVRSTTPASRSTLNGERVPAANEAKVSEAF